MPQPNCRLPPPRPCYSPPPWLARARTGHGPPLGGGPAIILVRPQLAVNIGMCARAMANFGLDDLRLVNPRQGWPRTDEYREVAYSAAAGATDLLDAAKVFPSVEAAVGDLHAVYATTARERGQMKAVLSPSVAMGATAAAVGEKRGILFGPERTGLDNDEVALADAIITFPSSPTYASLNLSQAVLLCGYEWFKAAHGDAPPPPTIPRPPSPPAQREMLLAFFDYLEGKLEENGFFRPVDQEAGDAAKPAQHLPSHGADAAGRADIMGGGGSPGRGAAGRGQDAQARAARKRPRRLTRAGSNAAVSMRRKSSPDRMLPGELKISDAEATRARRCRATTWAPRRGSRSHVVHVVHVMVMMVVVMMMVVMMVHRWLHRSAAGGAPGLFPARRRIRRGRARARPRRQGS